MVNAMAANQDNVMRLDADPVDFIKFSGTRNDHTDSRSQSPACL